MGERARMVERIDIVLFRAIGKALRLAGGRAANDAAPLAREESTERNAEGVRELLVPVDRRRDLASLDPLHSLPREAEPLTERVERQPSPHPERPNLRPRNLRRRR